MPGYMLALHMLESVAIGHGGFSDKVSVLLSIRNIVVDLHRYGNTETES